MKNNRYFSAPFYIALGVFLSLFIFSFNIFSQSGKKVEPTNESLSNQTKTEPLFPVPKYQYEYIKPQTVVDFMYELKDRAKRGFRLYKVTALPGGAAETTREKSNKTILAGIVRYDGEQKYDYNFFFAEGEPDPDKKLSSLASNGWYFREDVMIYGGGADEDGIFANSLYDLPTVGNLYILERTSGEPSGRMYKLLKAGVRLGNSPTPKMQGLLNTALEDGFLPVATYYTYDVKGVFSIDSFFGVLVEKFIDEDVKKPSDEKIKYEYRFVRSNRSNGLQKEILETAKEGYRVHAMNFNSAILAREKANAVPVTYRFVDSDGKTYGADFAEILKSNANYVSGGIDMVGSGDFIKALMLFETNSPDNEWAEFQMVTMIPSVPKQYRKNRDEYLKTLGDPQEKFDSLLAEGFQARDIIYSNTLGLMVLLDRTKR